MAKRREALPHLAGVYFVTPMDKNPNPCGRARGAVVENLAKRREALPHLAGVYFVTPTEQSARLILEDWKARP